MKAPITRVALSMTDGIVVVEHKLEMGPEGVPVLRKREFKHYVILSEVAADTPANRAFSKGLSHAARLGCLYCLMRGQAGGNGHGMYFTGYCSKVAYGVFLQPAFGSAVHLACQ